MISDGASQICVRQNDTVQFKFAASNHGDSDKNRVRVVLGSLINFSALQWHKSSQRSVDASERERREKNLRRDWLWKIDSFYPTFHRLIITSLFFVIMLSVFPFLSPPLSSWISVSWWNLIKKLSLLSVNLWWHVWQTQILK